MNKLLGLLMVIVLAGVVYWEFQSPALEDVPRADAEASLMDETSPEPASLEVPEGSLILNTESSSMEWEASRIASAPHIGRVGLKEGYLSKEGDVFTGGSFVIDMTDMVENAGNERVIKHLQNEDFFHVEKYPTSVFQITSVSVISDQQVEVTGDLTILDSTHEISFTADMVTGEAEVRARASFTIDRTRWGITYGSGSFFEDLGDKTIRDEVQFRLDLLFEQA